MGDLIQFPGKKRDPEHDKKVEAFSVSMWLVGFQDEMRRLEIQRRTQKINELLEQLKQLAHNERNL